MHSTSVFCWLFHTGLRVMDIVPVCVYSLSRGTQWPEDTHHGGVFLVFLLLGDAPGDYCVARDNR